MSKFKVGDMVRILDGSKIENYACGWNPNMGRYVGDVYKVANVAHYNSLSNMYKYELEGVGYVWDERVLERCGNETIVIYRKDNEVISLDKRTGKKAIAKCSPEDTFDFNIGAKLAFERLMNGNKESITVEDMRKKLDSYCFGRSCCGCKLESPTYRCGRGAHFMTKDDAGNYKMSNKEIKAAFNIVFGTGVKEVKTKEPHKFKVGDIVKCNNPVRYCFTDDDMTRCKVTKVSEDGKYISVEILEHKRGSTCKFYGFESNCFDLVEEAPKVYNGKIIFTKGDGMFKTGHIYEVKDGRINTDRSGRVPTEEPLKDIEDVKDYFTGNCDGNRKREKVWSAYTLELMEVKED